ncbi:hypothetical protein Lalb_Chr11g0072171 [Lupinus albus]|uniref:Gag1-like clamp domain-containing protein n=1 Tax=Lupinus albus TaxID=3870 RepID=A0A6A4PT49_LUPAL|nr:hypothetical protein Lalb_Chr11g0072171 [Lupinus albus]
MHRAQFPKCFSFLSREANLLKIDSYYIGFALAYFCSYLTCFITSSGCFGCCTKPTPIIAVDEAVNGLRIQGQTVTPTIADGFWSSSTCDVDNSTVQSQRSIPSEGTDPEFVNQGKFCISLLLWNESRLKWTGSDRPRNPTRQKPDPRLNANATYESLLANRRPFPKSVPLSEMVEFLVNVWEQEGKYD